MKRDHTDAVILANGDYPWHAIPLGVLAAATFVACCDGAANEYIRRGHLPDLIVGDGDSLCEEYRRRYTHLIHRIAEQESNDLTKAVRHLLQEGKRRIDIVGATGKREDHTLGNISLLAEYTRAGAEVRMFTDHGVFLPCCGTVHLPCRPGQQLSIFNINARGLHAEGLAYPLRDFDSWWQGTLNACTGEEAILRAEGEYLVFATYPD